MAGVIDFDDSRELDPRARAGMSLDNYCDIPIDVSGAGTTNTFF